MAEPIQVAVGRAAQTAQTAAGQPAARQTANADASPAATGDDAVFAVPDDAFEAPAVSRPPTQTAGSGGFYIAGRVGGAFSSLSNLSPRFGGTFNDESPSALGFSSAVEAGFETHRLGAPVRLGFQIANANFNVFNADERGGTQSASTEFDVNSFSAMAAVTVDLDGDFEIIDTGPVTPFLVGGLGMAINVADVTDTAGQRFDDLSVDFAWMLGAGAAIALDDQLSLEARYVFSDRGEVARSLNGGVDPRLRAHEFTVGARYSF